MPTIVVNQLYGAFAYGSAADDNAVIDEPLQDVVAMGLRSLHLAAARAFDIAEPAGIPSSRYRMSGEHADLLYAMRDAVWAAFVYPVAPRLRTGCCWDYDPGLAEDLKRRRADECPA